jgi:peptidoglycan/LPS O-acetylase OafA/YrhL
MSNTIRIKSLEALRALAFTGVMLSHTGISRIGFLGGWGVSVFLVLSGFVSVISQQNKEPLKTSPKEVFRYAISKIKKLYLLHVLTTLANIIFSFVGDKTESIERLLTRLLANLLLIQEWLPLNERSMNGASWFLCPLFLSYFIFPFVINKMKKNYTNRKALFSIITLYIIQVIICLISKNIPLNEYEDNMFLVYNVSDWIIYSYPITRVIEIIIGYNLGYLYIHRTKTNIDKATLKEAFVLLLVLLSYVAVLSTSIKTEYQQSIPTVNPNNWWRNTLLYTPTTCLLIYLFAFEEGKISKILTNKVTLYLAKISPYGFLIHYVVFRYLDAAMQFLISQEFKYYYGPYIKITLGIILSIICCEIWMLINKKFLKTNHTSASN